MLRLPTMSEVRAAERQASQSVAGQLDSFSSPAVGWNGKPKTWPRSGSGLPASERNREALTYEESQRAQAVARSQEDLVRSAESLKQSLEALQRSAEAARLNDSSWQRQLAEIREQLERAVSRSCEKSSRRCSRPSRIWTQSVPRRFSLEQLTGGAAAVA